MSFDYSKSISLFRDYLLTDDGFLEFFVSSGYTLEELVFMDDVEFFGCFNVFLLCNIPDFDIL